MAEVNIPKFIKNCGITALEIKPLNAGQVNKTYLIKTLDKPIILKQYKFTRKTKDIFSELKFIRYLKLRGFPVPEPIAFKNKYITHFKKIRFVFFEYLPGIPKKPEQLTKKEIEDLIQKVAHMHRATQKLIIKKIKPRRDMFTFDFEDFVINFAKRRNILLTEHMKDMINITKQLKKQLLPQKKRFNQIIIHNDLSINNLKFQNNALSAILDFDDFCKGSRISDLSNLLIDLCIKKNSLDFNKVYRFIKIYERSNKLQKKELQVIKSLLIHRLSMYVYFHYFNFLIRNNKKDFNKSNYYYNLLKNS